MSLDKSIKHGKEHRKGYRERGMPGEYDVTCRPHGGSNPAQQCPYCLRNRQFRQRRAEALASLRIE